MALRQSGEFDRLIVDGAHYRIDAGKGTSSKYRLGEAVRTVRLPRSKRPVLEASGRMYARCESDGVRLPSDPPPGFWHYMTVEQWIGKNEALRAYAVHRYANGGRSSDFPNWRAYERMLGGERHLPDEHYDERAVGEKLAQDRRNRDAARRREERNMATSQGGGDVEL